MRKLFFVLLTISLLPIQSCDDGDIIDVNLDFDDEFFACDGVNGAVFYKTKDDPSESLSFLVNTFEIADLLKVESDDSLTVEKTGTLYYRTYNNERISNLNLFCSNVPTSEAIIKNSDQSSSTIIFNTVLTLDDNDGVPTRLESTNGINPIGDDDNDNILNYLDDDRNDPNIGDANGLIEEGFDTDGDGLANFVDFDDDGDNVPTSEENPDPNGDGDLSDAQNTDANLTGGDTIPDYLDKDDDGDGVDTRDEENLNQNEDPTDDDETPGLPNYLNPIKNAAIAATHYRAHSYDSTYTIRASIFDIDLEEISQVQLDFGFLNNAATTGDKGGFSRKAIN